MSDTQHDSEYEALSTREAIRVFDELEAMAECRPEFKAWSDEMAGMVKAALYLAAERTHTDSLTRELERAKAALRAAAPIILNAFENAYEQGQLGQFDDAELEYEDVKRRVLSGEEMETDLGVDVAWVRNLERAFREVSALSPDTTEPDEEGRA